MVPGHLVLFDGVCNLCNSSVQRIIRNDKHQLFYFASLQSDIGKKILQENSLSEESIIYLKNGKVFTRSGAVLRIAWHLRFPYPLAAVFLLIPPFIRDIIYNMVARNRYRWYGKMEHCMIPDPKLKSRFIDQR